MSGRGRGLVVASAYVAAAIWLTVNGATAQVPDVPAPPDPSTVPTTAPPTEEPPAPAPDPAPPTDTLPPGTPDAPPTPVDPAPAPGATTTTVPDSKLSANGLPPARTVESSTSFGLDLSEIDALRRAARGKGPRAPEPDYGFDRTLAFGPGVDAGTGGDSEEALELGAEDEKIARIRSTGAVAGGLMSLLLMGITRGALRQARPARPGRGGD